VIIHPVKEKKLRTLALLSALNIHENEKEMMIIIFKVMAFCLMKQIQNSSIGN
jgi:hypothetical protein